MSTNPFQSRDVADRRLVWDPAVHELYDEHCSYFLLRMREPDPNIVETMTHLLVQAQISSFCVYVVYGYYDVLVRVWSTGQKRGRFIDLLDRNATAIESVDEFLAGSILFLWSQTVEFDDPRELQAFRPDIEIVSRAILRKIEPPVDAIDTLMKARLIHTIPERHDGIVKFYIALSRVPGGVQTKAEFEQLRQAVDRVRPTMKDLCLYRGRGFANYLIKGVASAYRDIMACTYAITQATQVLDLRPMTLLIANNDAPEFDHVDVAWVEFETSLLRLEKILGGNSAQLIAELALPVRNSVGRIFVQFDNLLRTPFEPIFLAVLHARLSQDVALLAEKLSFLLRLEGMVRKFLVEVWASELGRDWYRTVKEAAGQCGVSVTKDPVKEYTLHDIVTVTLQMTSHNAIPQERIDTILGQSWGVRLSQVKDLRNQVAHGDIYDDDVAKHLFVNWEAMAESVCNVGYLYNALLERQSAALSEPDDG